MKPSSDWENAPTSFFNDATCSTALQSDCIRWEPYPVPLQPGGTTAGWSA